MKRYIHDIKGAWKVLFHHAPKRYFAVLAYEMLVDNARLLLGIIAPALIVDCILAGGQISRVLVLSGMYAGIVIAADMLRKSISLFTTAYWYRAANLTTSDVCEKEMMLDCADLDSPEVLDKAKRAAQSPWEFLCIDELMLKRLAGAVLTVAEMLWILSQVHIAVMAVVFILSFASAAIQWRKTGVQHKKEAAVKEQERRAEYPLKLLEDYRVGKEIRVYQMLPFIIELYRNRNKERIEAVLTAERYGAVMESLVSLLNFSRFLLVYMAAIYKYMKGVHSLGAFTMYYGSLQAMSDAMEALFECVSDIRGCVLHYEDYQGFLEYGTKTHKGTKDAKMGEIRFDQVDFSYAGSDNKILNNLNFSIKKGEHIAVVGENGAGKSTLIKLLTGLYQPLCGQITIEGTDIKEFLEESYRSLFAPVFQDFELYSISIGDNIAFKHEKEDEERIWRALEDSGAKDIVSKLPHGLQTTVTKLLDNQGVEFSGGEAQRLAIARAYYKDAPILILDEPTAALDPMAEEEIYQHIHKMSRDKTVIYISHRISTTRHADRILVVGEGHILESGSFLELMEKKGLYYRMFEEQAAPYQG